MEGPPLIGDGRGLYKIHILGNSGTSIHEYACRYSDFFQVAARQDWFPFVLLLYLASNRALSLRASR